MSWSDVSCEEGMVGLAVVDISSVWTVNVPSRSPPELIRLRAKPLISYIRGKETETGSVHRLLGPGRGWQSTCAPQVGSNSPLGKHATARVMSPWRRTDTLSDNRVTSLWLCAGRQRPPRPPDLCLDCLICIFEWRKILCGGEIYESERNSKNFNMSGLIVVYDFNI